MLAWWQNLNRFPVLVSFDPWSPCKNQNFRTAICHILGQIFRIGKKLFKRCLEHLSLAIHQWFYKNTGGFHTSLDICLRHLCLLKRIRILLGWKKVLLHTGQRHNQECLMQLFFHEDFVWWSAAITIFQVWAFPAVLRNFFEPHAFHIWLLWVGSLILKRNIDLPPPFHP